jgi:vacuolar-type H+-ATPase subunit H
MYEGVIQELIDELVSGKNSTFTEAKTQAERVVNDAKEKAEQLLGDVDELIEQIRGKK